MELLNSERMSVNAIAILAQCSSVGDGAHMLLLHSDVFHLPNQNTRQKVQRGTRGTQLNMGTGWL